MKTIKVLFLCFVLLITASCASTLNKELENCLFNLDEQRWDAAVADCTQAAAANASSELAALYLSAAYSGRAGVDLLGLMEDLSEAANEQEAFKSVHTAFVQTIGSSGLADLRSSITTLTAFIAAGYTLADSADFYGQLGLLETIEAFALPTISAQPTATAAIDPDLITEANKGNVQNDFIESDNHLIDNAGWAATHQLVKALRKNYHVMENVSAAAGFTVEELRDLTLCQLSANPDALGPGDFESTITACAGATGFDWDNASDSTANTL